MIPTFLLTKIFNIRLWLCIVFLSLSFGIYYLCTQIVALKKENVRHVTNIENMKFQLDTTKTKNGELIYSIKSLTVKKAELEAFSEDLLTDLDNMNLKLKNITNATKLKYSLKSKIDTVHIIREVPKQVPLNDKNHLGGIAQITYNKNGLSLQGTIKNLESQNPFINDLFIEYKDSLKIIGEKQYKRRWIFWRKVVGIKVHISSTNPNFHLESVKTFNLED